MKQQSKCTSGTLGVSWLVLDRCCQSLALSATHSGHPTNSSFFLRGLPSRLPSSWLLSFLFFVPSFCFRISLVSIKLCCSFRLTHLRGTHDCRCSCLLPAKISFLGTASKILHVHVHDADVILPHEVRPRPFLDVFHFCRTSSTPIKVTSSPVQSGRSLGPSALQE